jgi:hypothetical protein
MLRPRWREMTSEEHELISTLERLSGRALTTEEYHLALLQARQIGELPYDASEGCGYK